MDLEIIRQSSYLYILRERLDLLEPRFRTKYTNLYLLLGTHSAALIDTGCGMSGIGRTVRNLIGDRHLLVFNTHKHFDHVAGNREFEEIFIHKLDYKGIAFPIDLGFLKDSQTKQSREFEIIHYSMPTCKTINPLIGGEKFDLGDITVKVIFTPGHTGGSICLESSTNELFSGDTIQYGAVYLPEPSLIDFYLETLEEMNIQNHRVFPGHESYDLDGKVLEELISSIKNMRNRKMKYDSYLGANIIEDGKFTLVVPIE